jgi:uncharacterized protein YidB (DUF937 family)
MSLMDDLLKNVGGIEGLASIAARNPQVLAAAASLLSSKDPSVGGSGGLGGLMSAFEKKGLGSVMDSWIGTGTNQSIGADQVAKVLGNDTMSQFAGKAGIGIEDAGPALAAVLPSLIDQLSPKGKAPDAGSLEGALASILSRSR